jgi:hypothetical protein
MISTEAGCNATEFNANWYYHIILKNTQHEFFFSHFCVGAKNFPNYHGENCNTAMVGNAQLCTMECISTPKI